MTWNNVTSCAEVHHCLFMYDRCMMMMFTSQRPLTVKGLIALPVVITTDREDIIGSALMVMDLPSSLIIPLVLIAQNTDTFGY